MRHRMQTDCPDLVIANRISDDYLDLIHIEGFSRDRFACRKRASSLIVPGSGLVERRADGSALNVLNQVLTWQTLL